MNEVNTFFESGNSGDVYVNYENATIEKMVAYRSASTEIQNLKDLQGLYGIPEYLCTNKYSGVHFKGKYNQGIFDRTSNKFIKYGKAIGICMQYVGKYTLDNYTMLDSSNLMKIVFNACYIAYKMWITYNINHGDLHRCNVVFDICKPFQKTYYIGQYKYVLRNQIYKVYLVDFDSCDHINEMHDIEKLCSYFSNFKTNGMNIETFFKKNFTEFIQ